MERNNRLLVPLHSEAVRLSEYEVYGGGSVEVYDNKNSQWGSACAQDWDKQDADVICRQLGFLDGAAHGLLLISFFTCYLVLAQELTQCAFQRS